MYIPRCCSSGSIRDRACHIREAAAVYGVNGMNGVDGRDYGVCSKEGKRTSSMACSERASTPAQKRTSAPSQSASARYAAR